MDTDQLSTETYKAVLIEAEKFNDDLALQFGVMASSCINETEYLKNAKLLILEIRNLDEYDLTDMFFGTLPNQKALKKTLNKIIQNIKEVEKIPEEQRKYEF